MLFYSFFTKSNFSGDGTKRGRCNKQTISYGSKGYDQQRKCLVLDTSCYTNREMQYQVKFNAYIMLLLITKRTYSISKIQHKTLIISVKLRLSISQSIKIDWSIQQFRSIDQSIQINPTVVQNGGLQPPDILPCSVPDCNCKVFLKFVV